MIFDSNLFNLLKSNINYDILFSPYVKLEALKKVITSKTIQKIVVAWNKEDLIKGVSDLEVYNYCKENNIELYRNPKIHLKVFWDGEQNIILGSANVTQKGLGLVENCNHELSVKLDSVNDSTFHYLNTILNDSILITDDIFKQIKSQLENTEIEIPSIQNFDLITESMDYFRLSQLPQSFSPEYLLAVVKSDPDNEIDKLCSENDLKIYRVNYHNDVQFLEDLKTEFNQHPFIVKFKNHIESVESERYGGVVRWIQDNCKDVPIPRSFELKSDGIINILYRWICYFDHTFEVIQPNYSEIIRKKSGY